MLVKNYNTTVHGITGYTPEDALKNTKEFHDKRNEIIKQRLAKAKFLNRNIQELNIGDSVRLKIIRSIFEKGSDVRFTKTIHKIIAKNRDGSFKVTDRTRNYKRDELLKVNTEQLQTNPDQDNYETSQQMVKQHKLHVK